MKNLPIFHFLIVFALVGLALDFSSPSASAQLCDYFASPDGMGNGLSELSPYQISDFLSLPEREIQGKTLCLTDGIYDEALSISKSGTASQPIAIRALHDGQATIDANYHGRPLTVTGDYLTFDGIMFMHSSINDIVNVKGNYNIFRRCSFYYGTSKHGIAIDEGQHNLVEDCISAGAVNHQFKSWSDEGMLTSNTFRRCFALGTIPGESGISSSNRSGFNIYGGSGDLIENSISWGGTEFAAISVHSQIYESTYKCRDNKVFGSIFLSSGKNVEIADPGLGLLVHSGSEDRGQENAKNTYFKDCMISDNTYGVRIASRVDDTIIDHCTIMNSANYALSSENSSDVIKNTLIYNNHQGFASVLGSFSYINSFGNNSRNAPPDNCQYCFTIHPGQIGLTIPQNSPLKGAGENGTDIGANICYRYENGVLTDVPLWPWPMADRIKEELGIDLMQEMERLFGPIDTNCIADQTSLSCSEQNGSICTNQETCDGAWLAASDTDRCCSLPCTNSIKEDINGDGKVNAEDIQICVNTALGLTQHPRADVNNDNVVNRADTEQITRKILEKR